MPRGPLISDRSAFSPNSQCASHTPCRPLAPTIGNSGPPVSRQCYPCFPHWPPPLPCPSAQLLRHIGHSRVHPSACACATAAVPYRRLPHTCPTGVKPKSALPLLQPLPSVLPAVRCAPLVAVVASSAVVRPSLPPPPTPICLPGACAYLSPSHISCPSVAAISYRR
jgi:hypothetical protein